MCEPPPAAAQLPSQPGSPRAQLAQEQMCGTETSQTTFGLTSTRQRWWSVPPPRPVQAQPASYKGKVREITTLPIYDYPTVLPLYQISINDNTL